MAGSKKLDRVLTIVLVLAVVAVLGFAGYFGYTVYADRANAENSSAAMRVAKALTAQVKGSPNDAALRVRLGEALASANKPQQAIEQFNAALKIDPKHTGALQDLGLLAMSQSRFAEARSYFQKLVDATTNSEFQDVNQRREVAFYNLGLLAMQDHDYNGAIGQFKAALRIRNDASDTYYYLGQAFYLNGNLDEAVQQVRTAIMFDTNYVQAHYLLAQIYMDQKDKINASYEYHKVLTLMPENTEAQKAVAQFGDPAQLVKDAQAAMNDDTNTAVEDILIARNLDPENAQAAVVHGQILMKMGDGKGALKVYREALKLDPKNTQVQAIVKQLAAKYDKTKKK